MSLATAPVEELLGLPFLQLSQVTSSRHAYQLAKRGNSLRVMAEALRWGKRGARINTISPGIVMTPLLIAALGLLMVATAFLSGLFGMAGGMVLLGVLLVYFDVAVAMVLFSIIQFAANGWRALLWYRYVRWPIFFHYVVGAMVAFAALRVVAYVPDKATVYLLLGVMPLTPDCAARIWRPISRTRD